MNHIKIFWRVFAVYELELRKINYEYSICEPTFKILRNIDADWKDAHCNYCELIYYCCLTVSCSAIDCSLTVYYENHAFGIFWIYQNCRLEWPFTLRYPICFIAPGFEIVTAHFRRLIYFTYVYEIMIAQFKPIETHCV